MIALTIDSAKNLSIGVVIVLALVAVLSVKFVANVTKKAVLFMLFGALALGVWSQRQSLQTCADKVKSSLGSAGTSCKFLGSDIKVKLPGS